MPEMEYEEIEYIIDEDIEEFLQKQSAQDSYGEIEFIIEEEMDETKEDTVARPDKEDPPTTTSRKRQRRPEKPQIRRKRLSASDSVDSLPSEQNEINTKRATSEEIVNVMVEIVDDTKEDAPCSEYKDCSLESESSPAFAKKRQRRPELWKTSIRKRLRESGEAYMSRNNKEVPARAMKAPCDDCMFKCVKVFSEQDRTNIFRRFWNMTDEEKNRFYFKYVSRQPIQRRRASSEKKQFSFEYYLGKDENLHRVCRTFFLNTLCINQKRIYHCFANYDQTGNGMSIPWENDINDNEIDNDMERIGEAKEEEQFIVPSSDYDNCTNAESQTSSGDSKKEQKKTELKESQKMKPLRKVPAGTMKPPCEDCIFKCVKVFTEKDRMKIFQRFWKMTDEEKSCFYFKFATKSGASSSANEQFCYYLEKNKTLHRVCRTFFVNTLCIDQKRIFQLHDNAYTDAPVQLKRGRNVKRVTAPNKLAEVREHILSYPPIDLHNCRTDEKKKTTTTYIDSNLSVIKMYTMYTLEYQSPVALHIYRELFNNEFNISFYKSKKDHCDQCVIFNNKENIISANEKYIFEEHKAEINALQADRENDRCNSDPSKCIVCYGLQSVFRLPKGNASTFYYKRKLNVYNLTAAVSMPNSKPFIYCALWTEANSDRSGNDIASALIKILNEIVKAHVGIRELILWSDPQNRNKINTTALKCFHNNKSSINTIIQKYSEPEHSLIPEVDNIQRLLDKNFKNIEIHSPLHLTKLLQNLSLHKTQLKILPMLPNDFHLYSALANRLHYSKVPFCKIKVLLCRRDNEFEIEFKNSARENQLQTVSIMKPATLKEISKTPTSLFSQKLNFLTLATISPDKKRDIKDIYKYLPPVDRRYFENLFQTR